MRSQEFPQEVLTHLAAQPSAEDRAESLFKAIEAFRDALRDGDMPAAEGEYDSIIPVLLALEEHTIRANNLRRGVISTMSPENAEVQERDEANRKRALDVARSRSKIAQDAVAMWKTSHRGDIWADPDGKRLAIENDEAMTLLLALEREQH